MGFVQSLFRSLISSLIVTSLFGLIGVSLFVGDFPPSITQVKNVFTEYKNLIHIKEKIIEENKNSSDDVFNSSLQNGPREQLRKLAHARDANAMAADQILDEKPMTDKPVAVAVPTTEKAESVNIPKEWQEQFYQLRAEVFRLNQRIVELEKQNLVMRGLTNPPK